MALTSLEKVKVRLQIPNDDTSKDDLLTELILEAEVYVETYCGRKFEVGEYTERHKVNHKVFTNNYPIISVESLKRDAYVRNDIGEITAIDNYSYPNNGYIVHNSYIELNDSLYVDISNKISWINTEPSYVNITYTAGYEEIPSDLQVACTLVVVYFYNLLTTEGKSTEKIGDYSANYTDLPQTVKTLLGKYRKVRV